MKTQSNIINHIEEDESSAVPIQSLPQMIFTIEEVARILKTSKQYTYMLVKGGFLVGLKLGRLKVTRSELVRFLNENQGKDFTDLDHIRNLYDDKAC